MRPRRPAGDVPAELRDFDPDDWPGPDGERDWELARLAYVKANGDGTVLGDVVTVLRMHVVTRRRLAGWPEEEL